MTPSRTIPRSDQDLAAAGDQIATVIAAQGPSYSLSTAQVETFLESNTAFGNALAACAPEVRVPSAVISKNLCRKSLENEIRILTNYLNGIPSVTEAQKRDLGIKSRKKPTPVGAPTTAPVFGAMSVSGRVLSIDLCATQAGKRGRPDGVAGASVFSATGSAPPASMEGWTFRVSTGKTHVDLEFPTDGGNTVFVCAFWYNAKGESGPCNQPLRVDLPAATPLPTAKSMRLAA